MEATFDLFTDSHNLYRWALVAPDGEVIAQSEGYTTKQGALDSIAAVKKYALQARIDETSGMT